MRLLGDVLKPVYGSWNCRKQGANAALKGRADGLGLVRYSRPCPGDVRAEVEILDCARVAPGKGRTDELTQAGVFVAAGRDEAGKLRRYTLSVESGPGGRDLQVSGRRGRATELTLRRLGEKVAGCPVPVRWSAGSGAASGGDAGDVATAQPARMICMAGYCSLA